MSRVNQKSIRVVVLSCGTLGFAVAAKLYNISGIENVTVVTTPYVANHLNIKDRIRHVYRTQGWIGFFSIIKRKLFSFFCQPDYNTDSVTKHIPPGFSISHYKFKNFHDEKCLNTIE